MLSESYQLRMIKEDYRSLCHDPCDPWASCMGALFDIAAELYWRGEKTPDEWNYSAGATSDPRDTEGLFPITILPESVSADVLQQFGATLWRYRRILKRAGRDY